MASSSKQRKILTIEEKGAIIARIENGESNVALSKELALSHSTISTIWKNRNDIRDAFNENKLNKKKLKPSQYEEIDRCLLAWFKDKRAQGVPINGPILQAKANDFGKLLNKEDFKCSESWIKRFRQRHNIVPGAISGESANVNIEICNNWLKDVWPQIRKNYSDENIFNADETGLFYKMTPDKTLKFKGEKCSGGKLSKERITVLLAVNLTGSIKRKLLVIGKSRNPRCFKNTKHLPVQYEHNKRAWMVSEIFEKFLRQWDTELYKSKKKILLLVDNCTAHPQVKNLKAIELHFLPPNTTSVLQPLDQGIIKNLKTHFRQFLVMKLIEGDVASAKINILDAIIMLTKAWERVSEKTIINCFRHAGFIQDMPLFDEEDEIPLATWIQSNQLTERISPKLFENFINIDEKLATYGDLTDEDFITANIPSSSRMEPELEAGASDFSDEEEPNFHSPSASEALQALNLVRNFISFTDNLKSDRESLLKNVSVLEKVVEKNYFQNMKQTEITDFFK